MTIDVTVWESLVTSESSLVAKPDWRCVFKIGGEERHWRQASTDNFQRRAKPWAVACEGESGPGPFPLLGEITANLYTLGKEPVKREKRRIQERKEILE